MCRRAHCICEFKRFLRPAILPLDLAVEDCRTSAADTLDSGLEIRPGKPQSI